MKMVAENVTVIDNGAYTIKIGHTMQNEPK